MGSGCRLGTGVGMGILGISSRGKGLGRRRRWTDLGDHALQQRLEIWRDLKVGEEHEVARSDLRLDELEHLVRGAVGGMARARVRARVRVRIRARVEARVRVRFGFG